MCAATVILPGPASLVRTSEFAGRAQGTNVPVPGGKGALHTPIQRLRRRNKRSEQYSLERKPKKLRVQCDLK